MVVTPTVTGTLHQAKFVVIAVDEFGLSGWQRFGGWLTSRLPPTRRFAEQDRRLGRHVSSGGCLNDTPSASGEHAEDAEFT